MFKHLFNRNKAQKQPCQEVVAAPKDEMTEAIAPAENNKCKGGTVLRGSEPGETLGKNKTLLQLAEEGGWKVTEVPEYHIGDTIGGMYKIANKFSGGMGFVYITEPTGQGIRFAIKQPNQLMLQNKNFFARIIREADTWNSLGMHPNIAYCYFVKPMDNVPCIFIEYVDGGNLREWIAEGECLDIRASLNMAIQFCHGMEHAHQRGAIHRDIKPENVLMTKEGGVKITDFGLAGALEKEAGKGVVKEGSRVTQFGDVMGTEAYMAPEQWEDPHHVDARADIFSFGVCMWEMFCGKRPYKIAYGSDIETPTPARTLRPELTDTHIKLLYKCIELDKEKRYKDFTELREVLNNIYRELYHEDAPGYRITLPDSLANELNNRGYSCYQLGDKQKARQCWEEALKATPKHLEATYNLNHFKWDRWEITGDELLRQLELTQDKSPQYWLCVGWVYYEQGNQEAIQKIQDSENRITDPQFMEALEKPDRPIRRFIRKFKGHTGWVNSVCFSPDGRYILSGSADRIIRLWDTPTGRKIHKFKGHKYSVNSVCFSPDGRYILSGSTDGTIRLWKATTGKEIRRFKEHTGGVTSVCFSPNGSYVSSGNNNGAIRLWDVATGKEIRRFEGHTDEINSVCFSPDGRFVLSGSKDKTIRLWDVATGKENRKSEFAITSSHFSANTLIPYSGIRRFEPSGIFRRLGGTNSGFTFVCFSPDGKYILLSQSHGSNDKTIRLWDASTWNFIREFKGHTNQVRSICFSPNGNFIVSGSNDKTIRLWKTSTGKEIWNFEGHTDYVNSVCFSPNGRFVLSGGDDKAIRLWEASCPVNINISNFPILSALHTPEELMGLQKKAALWFNDAKSAKESGNYKKAISILRQIQQLNGYSQKPELLNCITTYRQEGKGVPIRLKDSWIRREFGRGFVCFSPDGKYVLSGSRDKTLHLREAASGKETQRFEGHTDKVNFVCFSPDGRYILSGSDDKTIRLWETVTGKEIQRFEGPKYGVNSICFSPDGRFVLSVSSDNTVRLWEATTGKEIRKFEGHTCFVNSVCFSPDGRYVLSGSHDKTIRLWDTSTGKEIQRFEEHEHGSDPVCFSSDGRYVLLECYFQIIRLWDTTTGRKIRKLKGHTGKVNSVCFSPNGKYVLSGSNDKTIRLWDTATGRKIWKLKGHTDDVNSVCFSPDGMYILSGSRDKTIRLWDVVTAKEIRKFEGLSIVWSVCFSPDGRYILSDNIILWELDWEWEFPEGRDN